MLIDLFIAQQQNVWVFQEMIKGFPKRMGLKMVAVSILI